MSTQPEALRLADRLNAWPDAEELDDAAAELRRLHAQRNELLEALRRAVDYYPNWKDGAEVEWRAKARAAIAKAEGK